MVLRLVAAILALVFILLGIPFLILGLVLDSSDADAFSSLGAAALVAGLVFLSVFLVLHRRAAAERRRRQEGLRASVEVVEAQLHQYTRIGVMLTFTTTIRYADGGTFTRKLLVPPNVPLKAGDRVEVSYDPNDPGNFELVA